MLTVVLVLNGLIGLACLWVAWWLWRLKNQLSRAADNLIAAEKAVYRVLYRAPEHITRGQTGTHRLRRNLAQLEPQLQQIQQLMTLLNVAQAILLRRSIFSQNSGSRRRSAARWFR
ncbi:hypothetical protein K9N68_23375 [Kovacikia minuta CCNUW1]|uniref:hypothetical protein n=1 Tax=Kovacikia minuta TaxID=2931930 RepID=UPI001CCE7244|nr:hypothetical protein [Kovacikia minuta]UBF24598.1 hypothetical protein K9N68_23375 [Kovacikia minuta CCNUW1]